MEEKHDVIINAAESLFIRFGFRKTTMEDIAKAAGIGKATLYYYFKSKEDIFAAMTERVAQTGLNAIIEASQAGETPLAKLYIFGESMAEFTKGKVDYYAALHEEMVELLPSIRKRQKSAEEYGVAALKRILQEGVQRQMFIASNVEATARMVFLLMQELTERIIIKERRVTWKDDMRLFLDLIVKGLETRD